jgi:HTH-type transcriptional regulator, sugar sensing transcriptional regulator
MIVKDELLSKLRNYFGLNLYEVRIWAALLSQGDSSAGELAEISNVPRSRAYDILESLEKKGFIVIKIGKPIKYLAVEPKEVVHRFKKSIKDMADVKIKKLGDLANAGVLQELTSLYTKGVEFVEPAELSGAIRGRHNIYSHLEAMIKNAEKSVTIVTTSKGVLRKIDALSHVLGKLSKKGVKIKIAAPMDKNTTSIIKDVNKYADFRNLKDIKARFCIVDGKELMFMVLDDEEVHPSYDIGIWINTPYFSNALEGLFNMTWTSLPNQASN